MRQPCYYTICHKHDMHIIYIYIFKERRRITVVYWVASNSLVFYGGQTFFSPLTENIRLRMKNAKT